MSAVSRYSILFLCTGNSARSIIAEAIANNLGSGKFTAYSAGSMPTGKVNPHALELLNRMGLSTEGYRSKSWDEFAMPGATQLDFVVTVCDNAAGEVSPIWPGRPMTAHWGVPDPAPVEGNATEIALAFNETYRLLNNRISLFDNLPIASLDSLSLKRRMDEIGTITDAPERA